MENVDRTTVCQIRQEEILGSARRPGQVLGWAVMLPRAEPLVAWWTRTASSVGQLFSEGVTS